MDSVNLPLVLENLQLALDAVPPEYRSNLIVDDKPAVLQSVLVTMTRLVNALSDAQRGCPCTLTKPCMDACTCANAFMSGGCLRCARYGHEEQRKSAAERIAASEAYAGALEELLREFHGTFVPKATDRGGLCGWCKTYQMKHQADCIIPRAEAVLAKNSSNPNPSGSDTPGLRAQMVAGDSGPVGLGPREGADA